MKSKTDKIIILFVIISLAFLLFILWLVDFSQFDIPKSILGTGIYGILMVISFILIFIFLQKLLLKFDNQITVLKLIISSTIVAFISLLFYQEIRQLIILREQYFYNTLFSVILSSAIPTIAFAFVAASVALELKKVKGIWRHVPTAALLIWLLLTKQYLHQIEW